MTMMMFMMIRLESCCAPHRTILNCFSVIVMTMNLDHDHDDDDHDANDYDDYDDHDYRQSLMPCMIAFW